MADIRHATQIEVRLLTRIEELRLLLKRDEVCWEPEQSSTRVLAVLGALDREVSAATVARECAADMLGRLLELRSSVARLYTVRAAFDDPTAAGRAFHEARAHTVAALQAFRDALTRYVATIFGQPGAE